MEQDTNSVKSEEWDCNDEEEVQERSYGTYNGTVPPIEITRSNSPIPSHAHFYLHSPSAIQMTESSPEPLDDLYEDRQVIRRPVVRWQSMKEDGKDANGLRRTETLPEMRNAGRRNHRGRRNRARNNNDEDDVSHGSLQHSFLRVPVGLSGRSSPSIASMGSEPESCIDDTQFMTDDDEIG